MRTRRLVLPVILAAASFAACGGGGLVPGPGPGPTTGGATGSGGLPSSGGGPGGGGLGGGEFGGAGGAQSTGGSSSTGGAETGSGGSDCNPRVHVLIQRSGAMFEHPAAEDNWWDAVADALTGDGELVSEFGDQVELSASVFSRTATDEMCPVGSELDAPVTVEALASALEEEATDFEELATNSVKVDAPVVEAVQGAAAELSDEQDAYILLITAGLPDSCEEADGNCATDDVFAAVRDAHADSIRTRVLFLENPQSDESSYPQGVANAGAGLGIADPGFGCGGDFEYSDAPGSASFEAPEATADVEQALRDILSEIAACD